MKTSTSKSSVLTQVSLSLVAIILGYLLLFSKTMQVTTVCQFLCGGLIAVGVISIVSYFLSGDYKRIDRYGFALGTMLVLMGIIGLIRIPDLTAHFDIYTGLLSMILTAGRPYRRSHIIMIALGAFTTICDSIFPLFNRYALNHFIGGMTLL